MESNNKDLLISIIMPVYNVEKYLDKAIKSVVTQTYSNWELILVEDCSTDASLSICREWVGKDTRIRLIEHEQNMGISCTRNDGIRVSRGDYIAFMDSDDFVHSQMYDTLVGAAKRENAGIIMCDSAILPDSAEVLMDVFDNHEVKSDGLTKNKVYDLMFAGSNIDWQYLVVWNKIYKAEIVKTIQFQTYGSEDATFNCTAIRLAGGLTKLNSKSLYYWVQRPRSITHTSFNKRNLEVLESYFDMTDEIATYEPSCFHSVAVKTFKVLLHTRYNSRKTEYCRDVTKYIKNRFPEFYRSFWNCKEISLRWKCLLSIFYYCPFTYNLFRAFCG